MTNKDKIPKENENDFYIPTFEECGNTCGCNSRCVVDYFFFQGRGEKRDLEFEKQLKQNNNE
jgi:hypothetical protein